MIGAQIKRPLEKEELGFLGIGLILQHCKSLGSDFDVMSLFDEAKCYRLGGLQTAEIYFYNSRDWEVPQIHCLGGPGSWLTKGWLLAEGWGVSGMSFIKALSPVMRPPPPLPNHLFILPPPILSLWELGLQHKNLGGGLQLITQ